MAKSEGTGPEARLAAAAEKYNAGLHQALQNQMQTLHQAALLGDLVQARRTVETALRVWAKAERDIKTEFEAEVARCLKGELG